ncbi:MAG: RNB domain-containing ribonuclease [Propionibacteriaceae bacterium]|jgi:exoribonuclease R|nr:RNB domain-containing ribonuclease [Propionibacteriaceae bacterium]
MPRAQFRLSGDAPAPIRAGFSTLIDAQKIRTQFDATVLAEAQHQADGVRPTGKDLTDLAFQTLDPVGSTDLDQAFLIERAGSGFRVWYAIADVARFVVPGAALDEETRRRGATVYAPTSRFPLHPAVLSEGAASLLADGHSRPAVVWRIDLDQSGCVVDRHVERAVVRSRAQLNYPQAQQALDAGQADSSLALLKTVGRLRETQEAERGGVSLNLPEQEVVADRGQWSLRFRQVLPVEGWNAQISLLTGFVAADLMLDAGVGVLRTLPAAHPDAIDRLRRVAAGLGIAWAPDEDYPSLVRGLDPAQSADLAMMTACTTVFRGAGYASFHHGAEAHDLRHAALAAPYAHVTAPLRRLVDRFATEVCLAICAGQAAPEWADQGLDELPGLMASADQRSSGFDRGVVSLVEALVLSSSVGRTLSGTVVSAHADAGRVQIPDPAVQIDVTGKDLPLGQVVEARIVSTDLRTGTVVAVAV